jgi:3-dehydroquinate synthase II
MVVPRVLILPSESGAPSVGVIQERARSRGFATLGPRPEADLALAWSGDSLHLGEPGRTGVGQVAISKVATPSELAELAAELRAGTTVLVEWANERVLPLETLVAARTRPDTLWAITDRVEDVPVFLGALEHGADHVILRVESAEQIDRLEAILEGIAPPLLWVEAEVRAIRPAGLGDRVIVDTTSLLEPDEALGVGSSAALLLAIASEATGSRFTRPRPFRVNAGAAHQYVLLGNGETRYLSELVAGDAVVVAVPGRPGRIVRVGRIKIERRPLAHITVHHAGREYTTFPQEAETVRLLTTEGARSTGELRVGHRVHALALPAARHLGHAVHERIEER